MSEVPIYISNAASRANHFAQAVTWFQKQLESQTDYQAIFQKFVDAICLASVDKADSHAQIHFIAIGKSAGVARLAVSMLVSVGIRASFIHATEAFHGDFGTIRTGDSIVCISAGGKTTEVLELIPHAHSRHCTVFAITAHPHSPLAEAADYTLCLPGVSESCPLDQAPMTSTITTLALCQLAVAASIEVRSFELTSYARNHPGGSIGKRIYVRVDDCLSKNILPIVALDDSFQSCVSHMTNFAKAGLLVVENQKLCGLITEKDMRVAMEKHGPNVFGLYARDLMNANPITLREDTLAVEALRLMQHRQRPLNVMPIVTKTNEVVGLLHIHELIAKGISLE